MRRVRGLVRQGAPTAVAVFAAVSVTAVASGVVITSPSEVAIDVIERGHLVDGAVGSAEIEDSTITSSDIGMREVKAWNLDRPFEWRTVGDPGEPAYNNRFNADGNGFAGGKENMCGAWSGYQEDQEECGWQSPGPSEGIQFSKDVDQTVRLRGEACFTVRDVGDPSGECVPWYQDTFAYPTSNQRVVFTLPESHRPSRRMVIPIAAQPGNNPLDVSGEQDPVTSVPSVAIDIRVDGQVVVAGAPSWPSFSDVHRIRLDGVAFRAAVAEPEHR